jgi:hypothetical protein
VFINAHNLIKQEILEEEEAKKEYEKDLEKFNQIF